MVVVAKLLQALGMVLLPVGLSYGIMNDHKPGAIGTELGFLAAGVVLFLVGKRLEGAPR